MEPKTKSASAREAVTFVRSNFPPGTKLRYKSKGDLYMIGGRYGAKDFWMMAINPKPGDDPKGIVPATTIVNEFEFVPA
ncbi:MAG: hypothetical protein WB561_01920 [Terracidiphilus sp.]